MFISNFNSINEVIRREKVHDLVILEHEGAVALCHEVYVILYHYPPLEEGSPKGILHVLGELI